MIPLPFLPLPPLVEATGPTRDRALARAPQAEWGLAHQGARVPLTRDQGAGWLVRRAGRRLVALGLPLGAPAIVELSRTARGAGLAPLLYKCDGATALAARTAGWAVLRIGAEAVIDLGAWDLGRPACRQLRRKLRGAAAAVAVATAAAGARELPLAAMAEVSEAWCRKAGRERGFSMGRFEAELLVRQRVVLGWAEGRLLGFASFHVSAREWTLDLMRQRPEAPDGLMHRLIVEAVAQAHDAGARRLSLAAVPEPAAGRGAMECVGLGACGLAQFKRSFGPRLLPRYAAAPSRASLALGLAAVGLAVHRPPPLDRDGTAAPLRWRRPRRAFDPARPRILGLNPSRSHAMRGRLTDGPTALRRRRPRPDPEDPDPWPMPCPAFSRPATGC